MLRHTVLSLLCAASLAACAHSEQAGGFGKVEPSGFLNDYSKLRPAADDTQATLAYLPTDKAKFKSYTKIFLEPVQVWRGEKSDAKDLDKEDTQHLSQYLYSRLDEELRKDYTMVKQPGPGVMRLRVGITEAGKGVPLLDNLTAAYPTTLIMSKGKKALTGTESLVGKASVEMEATDSETGEVLAAAVDRRGGGKYAWKALSRWEDVEQAYSYWAKKTRWRACLLRGDAGCQKPED